MEFIGLYWIRYDLNRSGYRKLEKGGGGGGGGDIEGVSHYS